MQIRSIYIAMNLSWFFRNRRVKILMVATSLVVVCLSLLVSLSWRSWQTNQKQVLGAGDRQFNLIHHYYRNNLHLLSTLSQPALSASILDDLFGKVSSVNLSVPLIKQIYSLSCEAAALEMSLSYKGIRVSQDQLIGEIGFSEPINRQEFGEKTIWGDPDEGFVGNYKGVYAKVQNQTLVGDGWGTNEGPVLRVAKKYLPNSYARTGATLEDIKDALFQDKPVIIWLVQRYHSPITWEYFTLQGKRVTFQQFHVVVVTGLEVQSDGSVIWLINDPIYGHLRYSSTQLETEWQKYNSRMVAIG